MPYHSVLEYIAKATTAGADKGDIELQLRAAGWYTVDIRDAFELHARLTSIGQPAALPVPPANSGSIHAPARQYNPRIIAVAMLSFAIAFVGYLLLTR